MRGQRAQQTRKTFVGYVRVSTEEQAATGVSLEAQRARIEAYGLAMGRNIDEFVIDAGESAKTLRRPGMQRLLQRLENREIAGVIALKLDRLTRSVRDLSTLLELFARHEAALVSVTESLDTSTAAGRMVVHMLAVISQWEREAIGERTAFALAHKRQNRLAYGPPPFGYRREGQQLVEDAEQQAALAAAIAMSVRGASLRQIGAMLTARQVRPPRGGREWYAATVRAILRSQMVQERLTLTNSDAGRHQ